MRGAVLAVLAAFFATAACALDMEAYDRLRESLKAPKLHPGITWAQLRRLHEEQLSKMYVVRGGKEWIQVRGWSPMTCELRELPAYRTIPRVYEVEIHRLEPSGGWFARVARQGAPGSGTMGEVIPPKGMAGAVGDVKTLWLVQRHGTVAGTGVPFTQAIWDVIPEETAAAYRVPTAREVALAMRDEGKTFVVRLPVSGSPCPRCGGRGVLARSAEAPRRATAGRDEGDGREDFLSRPSTPYLRAQSRTQGADRAETFRCPACAGRGSVYEEAFRTIFFKKP